ncbi:MAG TPA: hypothetical protein VGD62_12045, partial [Acidobacteriaceae bacterium]
GVKYQTHPKDADSEIVIHVRMLDHENSLQQEALGIVGVNLLYGAFFLHQTPDKMLESLLDNLTTDRIEIDMAEFSGIEFRHVDNRVMSLKLVQLGLSGAAMFGPSGEVLQPSEVLRKRPILVERGSFRPPTLVNIDMLNSAHARFATELHVAPEQIVELTEITMSNLMSDGEIDLNDFLARADLLAAAGKTVLISDYFAYYRLAKWLARYTTEPIALTMGVSSLEVLFNEQQYAALEGGILEGFGKLFTKDLRIYVYPYRDPVTKAIRKVDTAEIAPDVRNLYHHVVAGGKIKQLDDYNEEALDIFSRDILKRIKNEDPSWIPMVPPEIAELIKKNRFFGYREPELRA